MSDKPMSESRRDAIKAMMGGLAAVPLMNLVGMAAAQAKDPEKEKKEKADLPHLDEEKDPTALALEYRHDATVEYKPKPKDGEKEPKAPKVPMAPKGQTCANCMFIQDGAGDWRPCQLFPGKAVSMKGWCASWAKKPGA
ncbi:high-potential iron-sulfur protein [Candidatus Thiosymbion oneisti]|uniref:high-potential iron-sulfur protein n=1 Tax=Candidatus Thiosymbion oneisti TaxID=589554 RepID=UPI000B7C62D3|nr:high-potential iron-sulfur protein [Candidatus Thiosymbion oneisti]